MDGGGARGGIGGCRGGVGPTRVKPCASPGKGVNATVNGVLTFLAPGKLTVAPAPGTEQALFVGSQTKALGIAVICASNHEGTVDGNGYGTAPSTEAQWERAASHRNVRFPPADASPGPQNRRVKAAEHR